MFGQQNGILPGRGLSSPPADDRVSGKVVEQNIVKSGSGIMDVGESSCVNNIQSSDNKVPETPTPGNQNSSEIKYSSFEDMILKRDSSECDDRLDENDERNSEASVTGTGVTATSRAVYHQEDVAKESVETPAVKKALDCG